MRAKMEQYKVDVRVDGKSGYSTMVTACIHRLCKAE